MLVAIGPGWTELAVIFTPSSYLLKKIIDRGEIRILII